MLRILFVCNDNSCASQMAEAFANMHGHEGVEAYSAAPLPAMQLDERTVSMMQDLGYDISQHRCRALEELPDLEFDYLVTLRGPVECPITKAGMQIDWDIPDPSEMSDPEFRSIRDAIGQRVYRLITAPRFTLD